MMAYCYSTHRYAVIDVGQRRCRRKIYEYFDADGRMRECVRLGSLSSTRPDMFAELESLREAGRKIKEEQR